MAIDVSKEPKIVILILNYNSACDTLNCLESVSNANYQNYELIIVDNASEPGSLNIVKNAFPDLEYIESRVNLGFAGGVNLGIEKALKIGAKYVLLLNNDTVVDRGFLFPLVETMERNEMIAAVNPKIYYFYSPNIIWCAGALYDDSRPDSDAKHIGQGEIDLGQYDWEQETQRLTGCCMLLSIRAIKAVGLFDSDYFCYVEDMDWCYRAKKGGYKLFYVPASKIWHKVSVATGGECSPLSCYYTARNKLLFIEKNYGWSRWRIIINALPRIMRAMFSLFLFRKIKHNMHILRAYVDYLLRRYGQWR